MASSISESLPRFTADALRYAAKQSEKCIVIPVPLRRAIKRFLREQEQPYMKRKVLSLSQSFNDIKDVNLLLTTSTSKELVEDPLKYSGQSKRWKIESNYGDIGFKYSDDQTAAYVASRMPAVFSACFRVLIEVCRRLPDFTPKSVLDFGGGSGSALWAMREVWPQSIERFNLIEPSQSMQRAGQSLLKHMKNLPHIQSYATLQALNMNVSKSEREHDLVIASYVLGEIPSLKDRITIVRQLWDHTRDVLVLVEPGTPQGSSIIAQMRSHILWMEKRKSRKLRKVSDKAGKDDTDALNGDLTKTIAIESGVCSKDLMATHEGLKSLIVPRKNGAFIVAPCGHDGQCPLQKSGKYCHFVQRLQRTTSQRAYKRSKGVPLRGFEDEKFSFVVFRRGQRPTKDPWPLDGMKFDTLKEQHAKRNPEDLEIDYEDQFASEDEVTEEGNLVRYESDMAEKDAIVEIGYKDGCGGEDVEGERKEEADLGSGWGRIIFSPLRRGKRVELDICRSTNREGSEGSFDRIVLTKSKNPALHHQARRSLWGDLWPF
ncbi:probable S-adenosyl-L-methionine-dependent RNA methyltransferase RSM22, mitochondrial [Impatiens glandulifera]|uniref:probable S-adenosyl-L-methionine-dependent RNA methyltransferase RSM22, mitochondrial n=1 Tax=Impatiens glandulifera TaxID=253017 RepID=UPI001FB0631E|nr:probable S-adenosyl-L-methionine-dependent RNA methyltransferase RSM22, mitochondrial [Impatiens glandulifera]